MEGSNKPFSAFITDDDIAIYLQNNPDFFYKKPALLTTIRLPHAERGAVSLIEAQLDKLRQKIASLEDEITALMTRANQNDVLFKTFAKTHRALFAATQLKDIQKALDELATSLRLSVYLGVYNNIDLENNNQLQDKAQHLENVNAAKIEAFKARHLRGKSVYLGRLSKKEGALFMPSPPELGSYAILPISYDHHYEKALNNTKLNELAFERQVISELKTQAAKSEKNQELQKSQELQIKQGQSKKQEMGFLVFASQDGGHFQPEMDTLFITQLSVQIGFLLQKWQR